MSSEGEREALLDIAVHEYAAADYWQLDAEYPTKTREDVEDSIEYARYMLAPVVDAVLAAGFHRRSAASIRIAVRGVLVDVGDFPERARPYLLGQDMGPLIDKVADAVLEVCE